MQVCNGRVACSPQARPFTGTLQTHRHLARRASRSEASAARILQVRVADGVEQQTESDEDLEKAMEEFLKAQQEKESGTLLAQPPEPVTEVVGSEAVSEQEAKRYCREVVRVLRTLKEKRDMSLNEVKLTVAIEDPIKREQKEFMGVEVDIRKDEGGASRDEIAAALVEVSEGRVPKDRIALRELYREIMDWPFVEAAPDEEEEPGASPSSPYEAITPTGVEGSKSAGWRNTQARPKMMGRDRTEAPQGIADMLPDWVGYGFLYFVSVIPVLIAGSVIAILFFNSLR